MKSLDVFLKKDSPVFIIAEIGNNHNGDLGLAKEMIDTAVAAGADAVKFQLRDMESLYGKDFYKNRNSADLGAQYTLDLLMRFNLSVAQMRELFEYSKQRGVIAFCTPWDAKSVDDLLAMDNPLFKVASADLTNFPLLQKMCDAKKPIICSTGMSFEAEIAETVAFLKERSADFALLHCNSTYPAPYKDINLPYMKTFEKFDCIYGYSGHERGYHIPIAAVALGAKIIEKHFTLDRGMEGVDHRVSLLPNEFKDMVAAIRDLEQAMRSSGAARKLSQGEMMNRENLAKSIVAARNIDEGEVITADMLSVLSPGQGLQPNKMSKLVGQKAKRSLLKGDVFFESDLPHVNRQNFRSFKFERKWGVPVRYHDLEKFSKIATFDFVEFHLSYGDMEEDLNKVFSEPYAGMGYTVHAPELFANDHIVDLCSQNPSYLAKSIANMREVVTITKELQKYFPNQKRPFIIATIGGFTTDQPLNKAERMERYGQIIKNLRLVEDPEVEILPQSTAPFPWHMGGQQYQNLFLYPDEIRYFCEEYGYRICLDVSHSYLACNHLGLDPRSFFEQVAPYTAHIHIGDSAGVDGEGLQIGEGIIDFRMLAEVFNKHCPDATFIPEIWQGHKNSGEGFWIACERLEGIL